MKYTSSAASGSSSFSALRKTMICYAATLRVVYLKGGEALKFKISSYQRFSNLADNVSCLRLFHAMIYAAVWRRKEGLI